MSVARKPGYKETALGWIPENWEFTQLASIADVNPGRTKPLSDADERLFQMPANHAYRRIDGLKLRTTCCRRYVNTAASVDGQEKRDSGSIDDLR